MSVCNSKVCRCVRWHSVSACDSKLHYPEPSSYESSRTSVREDHQSPPPTRLPPTNLCELVSEDEIAFSPVHSRAPLHRFQSHRQGHLPAQIPLRFVTSSAHAAATDSLRLCLPSASAHPHPPGRKHSHRTANSTTASLPES
mgnify:CR=1 FL=1